MGILGIVPKKKKKKEVRVFRIKEVWVITYPVRAVSECGVVRRRSQALL